MHLTEMQKEICLRNIYETEKPTLNNLFSKVFFFSVTWGPSVWIPVLNEDLVFSLLSPTESIKCGMCAGVTR